MKREREQTTALAVDAHSPGKHVQPAHTEMRTLQASRERWGVWLLSTLREQGVPARVFAEVWLGVSESIARRLFTAEKPLTAAHVECAPDDVAEAFVEELVRRKWGSRGGLVVLGRVMGRLAKESGR